jgi:hypothetical protein
MGTVMDGAEEVCVDPGEREAILKAGEVGGPCLLGGGKGRAVGIRQWRRIDITGHLRTQETGSPQHQATFMHRVSVIVHYISIASSTTITGIVFYCIICFRKINHLVVKNHLNHPLVYSKLCRAQNLQ